MGISIGVLNSMKTSANEALKNHEEWKGECQRVYNKLLDTTAGPESFLRNPGGFYVYRSDKEELEGVLMTQREKLITAGFAMGPTQVEGDVKNTIYPVFHIQNYGYVAVTPNKLVFRLSNKMNERGEVELAFVHGETEITYTPITPQTRVGKEHFFMEMPEIINSLQGNNITLERNHFDFESLKEISEAIDTTKELHK